MPKCLTQQLEAALGEVLDEMENERKMDVVYIPPDVNELTDEEDIAGEIETEFVGHDRDIASTFEIHTRKEGLHNVREDLNNVAETTEVSCHAKGKSKPKKQKNMKDTQYVPN